MVYFCKVASVLYEYLHENKAIELTKLNNIKASDKLHNSKEDRLLQ